MFTVCTLTTTTCRVAQARTGGVQQRTARNPKLSFAASPPRRNRGKSTTRVAARKVAVPPPSPVNVEGLYAAATGYAGLLTVYLLLVAAAASLKKANRAEKEEVAFVYSTNAVGGLSRGKRVVGSGGGRVSTKRLVTMLLPLVAIYAVLLVNSYSPDTLSLVLPGSLKDGLSGGFNPQFVPKLANISTLFSRVGVASSLWVHLLAVNAFCAVSLMQRGLAAGIPVYHTIVLSMVFGPIGLLSSWVTECLFAG